MPRRRAAGKPIRLRGVGSAKRKSLLENLPPPTPGVVIDVPIKVYPDYLKLHGIEPFGYKHPHVLVRKEEEGEA